LKIGLFAVIAAALILLTPLLVLVVMMCKAANRGRLGAAPWTPVLILLLVSLSAWLWVFLANVQLKMQLHGAGETSLAVIAAIGVYIVWLVAPVAGVTWTLLKLRYIAERPE